MATMPFPPPGKTKLWHYCLRKRQYSRKAALREITRRNQRRMPSEPPYAYYLCTYCRHHHVGHQKRN